MVIKSMSEKLSTRPRERGPQHFARAVAEGVTVIDAARLYLGIGHGLEAGAAYRRLVDQLRSLARRAHRPG
jgi:hypothetical protein